MSTVRILPLLGCLVLALAGCQVGPPAGGGTMASIDAALSEDAPPPAPPVPPAAVSEALLPPLQVSLPPPASPAAGPRFDVTVDQVPARQFFLSLVEGTRENMVVHPGLEGEITLRLKNVTVADVLETVRDVYGYDYRRSATGYQVLPAAMTTRIYPVNYPNFSREGSSDTRVSSGQLDERVQGGAEGEGLSTSTRAAASVSTRSSTDFWAELETTLRAILGLVDGEPAGGAAVVVSPQAGIVTVRAMPAELRAVEGFLEAAQVNLQRQVILEAKILEVELSDGYQAGINWAALLGDGDRAGLVGQRGGGTLPGGQNNERLIDLLDEATGTFVPFLDPDGLASRPFGGAFSAALRIEDFGAFIELLASQGNVQVLSSPRVATVNNQKAVIKVGSDEFFVTDISSTTVTGTATTTTPDITLTPFFSGIALDVTPHIDADGYITLHVHPSISRVVDQQKTVTVAGEPQTLPLALSSVRESDSIVRSRSGQIVVIGGLIEDRTEEDIASTPVLGDLPFVGAAFRHTRQSARKSELVILLRPVVVGADTWRQETDATAGRVRALNRGYHVGGRPRAFGTLGEVQ